MLIVLGIGFDAATSNYEERAFLRIANPNPNPNPNPNSNSNPNPNPNPNRHPNPKQERAFFRIAKPASQAEVVAFSSLFGSCTSLAMVRSLSPDATLTVNLLLLTYHGSTYYG